MIKLRYTKCKGAVQVDFEGMLRCSLEPADCPKGRRRGVLTTRCFVMDEASGRFTG